MKYRITYYGENGTIYSEAYEPDEDESTHDLGEWDAPFSTDTDAYGLF